MIIGLITMLCGCATVGNLSKEEQQITTIDISVSEIPDTDRGVFVEVVSAITSPIERVFSGTAENLSSAANKIASAILQSSSFLGAERLLKPNTSGVLIVTNGKVQMDKVEATITNDDSSDPEKPNKIFKVTFKNLTITEKIYEQ